MCLECLSVASVRTSLFLYWQSTMSCVLCPVSGLALPELSLLPRLHFSVSAQAKYGVLRPVSCVRVVVLERL
jgi:hypothetical protein